MKFGTCLILIFAVIFMVGCKKQEKTHTIPEPDIYLAGSIGNDISGRYPVAVYWKNKELVDFTHSRQWSAANAIAVQNGDVYVAGFSGSTTGQRVATIWKNGVATRLATDTTIMSVANAIAISGGDVYVAGTVGGTAVYWKNGVFVNSMASGPNGATGIAVSGADVYVSGYTQSQAIAYWKNGVQVDLTTPGRMGSARAITVNGADVYVTGQFYGPAGNTGAYWKNGMETGLLGDSTLTYPACIAVSGGNVYMAGTAIPLDKYGLSSALHYFAYWKNGINKFPPKLNGPVSLTVGGMAVADTDIYVGGILNKCPTYWKNGIEKKVSDDVTATATGIAVVKK